MKIRSVVVVGAIAAATAVGGAASAYAAPPAEPDRRTDGPLLPGAPGFDEKLDKALNTLNLELGAGTPMASVLGTALGAATGCVLGATGGSVVAMSTSFGLMTPEDDAIGCLGGAAAGAAIGAVVAQVPLLVGVGGQFLRAMLVSAPARGVAAIAAG